MDQRQYSLVILIDMLHIFKTVMELVAYSQSQSPVDLHNSRFSSAH